MIVEIICDPACGTSGCLVTAGDYIKKTNKKEVFFTVKKESFYASYVSWIRHGQNHTSNWCNEYDDTWNR